MSFVFDADFPIKPTYRMGEIASALGVHFTTIRRWVDEGKIDSVRLGSQRRIPREALARFIEKTRA